MRFALGSSRAKTISRLLVLLLLFPSASPAARHKKLPTEELEKLEDPPLLVLRNEATPGMIVSYGAFTSYQVNVDANGQNITGDAANEPSICVDPTDHDHMAIGWRQFYSVGSNFREAGWAFSETGGTSWMFPGVLTKGVFRSDPVLDADASGQFFYLTLLENFYDDMWRSLTGGEAWTRLAAADGGDKEWFTIDKSNSSGRGFEYQSWSTAGNNYGGRQFTRSTDGGFTWLNPIDMPNSPAWGTLDVDSLGTLYLGGVNLTTNQIWCERSSNAKIAGITPTFDQSTAVNLGGDIVSSEPINPVGLVGQIFLTCDRSGTSTNNNVYMIASVQPTGFTSGSDVMFVRSTDGGHTFSAPLRVNDDPFNHAKWHWFGTISVAPNGRIDAIWLDSRNAANNTDSQLFYSYSNDAGVTWSPNVPVTPLFNPFLGYPEQDKMGDYMTIVSDATGGDVAYCATFNGEEDIYYVRVAPLQSQLLNISTRAHVLTGDQQLIAGFIINGPAPKQVIIRGLGPSLVQSGLSGVLADPTLELHQGNITLTTNDNWKVRADGSSQEAEIEATGIPPTNDLESAIVTTLAPAEYTAVLAGKSGGTGIGVVEVYDLTPNNGSRLANISTRGFVETGANVMIGGVIVGGTGGGGTRVIVRAIGPSLGSSGVQNPLADPTLELHDANGTTVATNDNWEIDDQTGQSQAAEVRATGLAPVNLLESAIVATLASAPYTAVVAGKNNTTGVALVEVYDLP